MFKCAITGLQSKPGEKLNKIVVQARVKQYFKWVRNEETNQWEKVSLPNIGWEIVKEIPASAAGKDQWESWSQEERAIFLKHMN